MGHFLPFFMRHAAHSQYDGIWFDLEHRAMTDREVQSVLALCHLHDIDCMIRPSTREPARLYRYLEDGAAGFMFPFVNNGEIARQLVQAVKFPPLGNRGVDGAGLDGDYTLTAWAPGSHYFQEANDQTFILAQIETPEALEKVDEIAAVEGIDCLFVGPADLGCRMSALPRAAPFNLDQAIERVARAARQSNKPWGVTTPSLEALRKYRKLGAQLVPWGGDYFLVSVLNQCRQELDGVLDQE
jgi:2-keto-3-deoxy-L-rhamnonate aldolase RhmA